MQANHKVRHHCICFHSNLPGVLFHLWIRDLISQLKDSPLEEEFEPLQYLAVSPGPQEVKAFRDTTELPTILISRALQYNLRKSYY